MIFTTEKTFDGLCAALFYAFTRKVFPSAVLDVSLPFMSEIGEEVTEIKADTEEINRVKRALFNYGGDDIIYQVSVVLSSCKEECLTAAFFYLKRTLELKRNLFYAYGEKCVTEFFYISDTVMNEKHRINGFLRFKETKKGVMYACFSPDNDILWLISPHFLAVGQGDFTSF